VIKSLKKDPKLGDLTMNRLNLF